MKRLENLCAVLLLFRAKRYLKRVENRSAGLASFIDLLNQVASAAFMPQTELVFAAAGNKVMLQSLRAISFIECGPGLFLRPAKTRGHF